MLEINNPATGQRIKSVETDTKETLLKKYKNARDIQPSWRDTPAAEKNKIIVRYAEQLEKHAQKLAEILTSEIGKPIQQAKGEIAALQSKLKFFVDRVASVTKTRVLKTPKGPSDFQEEIRFEPLGVVGAISAWNYPYGVGMNVFIPALLTGNTVLFKPSEFSTLSGIEMHRLLIDAGLPEHVFQLVVGDGQVGRQLLELPIDAIFFTGSQPTGLKIAESAAKHIIKCQLELGGKDPTYVCDDGYSSETIASLADGAFSNAGQSCCSVERLYVHEDIYDDFLKDFMKEVASFKS